MYLALSDVFPGMYKESASSIGDVICPSPLNMHLEAIRLLLNMHFFRGALLPLVVLGWANDIAYTTSAG